MLGHSHVMQLKGDLFVNATISMIKVIRAKKLFRRIVSGMFFVFHQDSYDGVAQRGRHRRRQRPEAQLPVRRKRGHPVAVGQPQVSVQENHLSSGW